MLPAVLGSLSFGNHLLSGKKEKAKLTNDLRLKRGLKSRVQTWTSAALHLEKFEFHGNLN